MFCIVSWHREAKDLSFWDGYAWGVSDAAKFFPTRIEAALAMPLSKPGDGFLKPNVLDVAAFNQKFGRSIGPRPTIQVSTSFDLETGILTGTHISIER